MKIVQVKIVGVEKDGSTREVRSLCTREGHVGGVGGFFDSVESQHVEVLYEDRSCVCITDDQLKGREHVTMNKDARARMYDSRIRAEQEKHKEELESAERKWEFRYNNQNKTIKNLEETVKNQRKKIRELKKTV